MYSYIIFLFVLYSTILQIFHSISYDYKGLNSDGYGGESTAILIDKALEHQNALGVSDVTFLQLNFEFFEDLYLLTKLKAQLIATRLMIFAENKQGNG